MLRPATPLTILYFVAFALLLLSTLSTPIIKSIPLGRYKAAGGEQFDFGVFGWCGPTQNCTSIALGYTTGRTGEFTLPDTTRHTLSAVLVVHPIAAFFTLICTILSASAHLHRPGRSPKFLLWLLILSFPTLLISLLAFLVDILLFIPGVQWGGWIVLAATILITVCSILTCAMRRTLVSRTARQKRIDNNADMNGETYYQTRQEQQLDKANTMPIMMTTSEPRNQFDRAESPPPLEDGSGMTNGKPPHPASYGYRNRPRPSTDDRIPLNPQNPRAASVRTTSTGRGANGNGRVSPVSPIGYEDSPPSGMRREPSDPRYRGPPPNGRGGPPQAYGRGRGGYPPPRGGYPPMRGGPPPRGRPPPPRGYPPRGGYARGGPPGMRPMPPPSQQGWYQDGSAMGPIAGGAAAGMAGAAVMGRGQRGPPPGYQHGYYGQPEAQDPYGGDASYDSGMYGGPAPQDPRNQNYNQDPYYQNSAPPGQDPRYDEPQSAVSRRSFERRPSEAARDPSSFGFSGRQPSPGAGRNGSGLDRSVSPLPPIPPVDPNRIPPGQAIEMDATAGSPQTLGGFAQTTYHNEPIEMGDRSPPQQHATPSGMVAELPSPNPNEVYTRQTANRPRKTSEPYYEDVEGPFAENRYDEHLAQPAQDPSHPSTLLPGGYGNAVSLSQQPPQGPPPPEALEHQPSASSFYGDALEHPQQYNQRSRSPAHSETSHFTSVSQRGVNPGWQQAGFGQHGDESYPVSSRGPPQPPKWREQDQVLTNNPDFAVPGGLPMNRVRENRGHAKGGSASGSQGGIYSGGRYPGAV